MMVFWIKYAAKIYLVDIWEQEKTDASSLACLFVDCSSLMQFYLETVNRITRI